VIHATQAAMQAAVLLTALLAFLALVASALALHAQAAAIVVGVSLLLFAALRPLTALGIRHARALSKAELAHASGVSESNRLAEAYGNQIQTYYQMLRQALPFVDRLRSAEKRYSESTPTRGRRRLTFIRRLTFDDVSYAYDLGRPALAHISFDIDAGEVIGIVGPSGAGKSTLGQLLLQLRVPTSGQALVNGDAAAVL